MTKTFNWIRLLVATFAVCAILTLSVLSTSGSAHANGGNDNHYKNNIQPFAGYTLKYKQVRATKAFEFPVALNGIENNYHPTVTVHATCPQGYVVSGGGYRIERPNFLSFIPVIVTENYPISDRTWQVTAEIPDFRTNLIQERPEIKVTAYAVCLGYFPKYGVNFYHY